jgi:predicted nuclease of restriction endonuclease-like (RecB) superfamily
MSAITKNYISEIKQILAQARQKAYAAVNFAMVEAYWNIGKRIVEEEQQGKARAGYGEEILQTLSKALTEEFGKGFSYANLRNFRQFYLVFPEEQICYAVRSKLTWTHYRLIMRVENPKARQYYLNECTEQMWSSRVLERNIQTFYYERLLSFSDKKETVLHSQTLESQQLQDFIKDPYVFEFLNIPESYKVNEKEIETALISNLQQFLLELGKGFSFVGRQFRISTETTHFHIDLVFYNYILKCFVLFDLKTTKLNHQDVGQMDMYVRMFNDLKRGKDDNPTIGVILCAEKDETVVKYSVLSENQQLFATKYMPYLPTEEELQAEIEREKRMLKLQWENEKL